MFASKQAFEFLEFEENKIEMSIDINIIREAFDRADISLNNAHPDPNERKQIGHLIFWIRKLKPIQMVPTEKYNETPRLRTGHYYINELAAVFFGLNALNMTGNKANFKYKLLHDLCTNLRYCSFSPSSIAAIIDSIIIE